MLLNRQTLTAIQSGNISLVFRRWKRPTVKTGGTFKTAVGVLEIDNVAQLAAEDVTERDARLAGFASRNELLAELDGRDGTLYRIELHYQGADPRLALRQNEDISDADFEAIRLRLYRLDQASRRGPWTLRTLQSIHRHPKLAARELAVKMEFEKAWLKTNVRKLKNLGLTISHHPGYELSPRGKAVLLRLSKTE